MKQGRVWGPETSHTRCKPMKLQFNTTFCETVDSPQSSLAHIYTASWLSHDKGHWLSEIENIAKKKKVKPNFARMVSARFLFVPVESQINV